MTWNSKKNAINTDLIQFYNNSILGLHIILMC